MEIGRLEAGRKDSKSDLYLALEQGNKKGAGLRWGSASQTVSLMLHVPQTQLWNSLPVGD